ncbi:cadherin-like beta sandwich domain-containing protein [Paenibacillus silviterrae]|uniref:cadherin-like beta sandwich domain-containing protein n=1 Tax=Paenibacillus silviterrae TaxID=3242194 RepID=UPI0025439B79|nr:cadherin-like beta sandwich domain-containing protein [Paenibacillus chinjuensis]
MIILVSVFGVLPRPVQAAASDWDYIRVSGADGLSSVIYDGNRFVAVSLAYIGTSSDGYTWSRSPSSPQADLKGVAYGNGVYVTVGASYGGAGGIIMASTDGITYNVVANELASETDSFNGVAYGNQRFVAVGWDGKIATSTDGTNWSLSVSGSVNDLYGVTYGNGQFIAVGKSGTILTSTDGITWTTVDSQTIGYYPSYMAGVTYSNGYYVAVGYDLSYNGAILTSTDGIHWTGVYNPNGLYSVTYGEGQFVAVGRAPDYKSVILTSTDSVSWTKTEISSNPFYSVAAAKNVILVGSIGHFYGRILRVDIQELKVNYSGGAKAVSPSVAADTYDYNVSVTSADTSLSLTAVFAPSSASLKMSVYDPNNNKLVDSVSLTSGQSSVSFPLGNGNTRIELDPSQKGFTYPKRTITVYRPPSDSMNADLAGLTVGSGTLSPVFSPEKTGYTVTAGQPLSSISITPTAAVANASISVNGQPATSGQTIAVDLAPGSNLIPVSVTSADGTVQKTYVLFVSGKTSDASLAGLTVSPGTLSPGFASDVHAYTISLNHSDTALTVTPTLSSPQATITVNGEAAADKAAVTIQPPAGISVVPIVVTAEDGNKAETYSLIVNRAGPSSNAALSGLSVSSGNIAFLPETRNYTVDVANSVSSIDVAAAVADTGASMSIAGTSQPSGASRTIRLAVGSTVIPIRVVAADGLTERTYLLTVNRAPLSNQAKLDQLLVNQGALSPGFSPDTAAYSLKVANGVSSIAITPAPAPGNTVTVANVVYDGQSAGIPVQLTVGTNIIPVVATAADGVTQKSYVVVVERAAPSGNALLNRIVTSAGTLSPAFTPENSIYNVNVPNATTSLTVTPAAQDAGAVVTSIGNLTGAEAAQPIPLDVGVTVIPIVVTAQDQVHKQTYVLIVHREEAALQAAPALTADSTANDTASAIELTFADNEAWRNAITAVKDGSADLSGSDYTVAEGKITIRAGVLGIGTHTITIEAAGYTDAAISQIVVAADLPNYRIDEPQVTATGLSATVTAAIHPLQASVNVPVTIIFQLMDGTAPLQMVAIKGKIQDSQEASAQFNLPAAKNYTVKVMVWDDLQHQVSQAVQQTKAIIVTP